MIFGTLKKLLYNEKKKKISNLFFFHLEHIVTVNTMAPDLKEYDEEQVRLMEEMCILVDRDDKIIGADTKKTCKF